jgi:hypothetical protein
VSVLNILKGIGGEFEIGRSLLASSGVAAIFTPIGFESWHMWHGGAFDVTAWCVAYPGGLAALSGVGVFSIGKKDQAVANARQTVAQPPLDDKTGSKDR